MILSDNKKILQTSYLEVIKQISELKEDDLSTEIEETKNGQKTISVWKDNKKKYLHSKYNPLREAEAICKNHEDIDEHTSIFFYGTGMGYHIELILEQYKNSNYFIYEPIPELLYSFLSNVNIKKSQAHRFKGLSTSVNGEKLDAFIDRNREKMKIVILPSHTQIYEKEYQEFKEDILNVIKNKKNSIFTNYNFQKRWVINSLLNFNTVVQTPNIILEKEGEFHGKTAVLVAAGPSLNDEIENLKKIKNNGLAYIFSVGSSINTLIHHGIYPDAACTYDPTVHNQKVFEKLKNEKINDIPLIFGSSVGHETLHSYPGEKYHMITSQDSVANYFLKNNIKIISDAPSIAVVTLQLLSILGFSNIILVGQNFGYRGKERYSSGIFYSTELTEQEKENGQFVKDVHGNDVLTNPSFNSMRFQMELYISMLRGIRVINTTQGGAHIEGTEFFNFEEYIDKNLHERIVEKDWLNGNKTSYNKDYIFSRICDMDQSMENAKVLTKKFQSKLNRIEDAVDKLKYNFAEKLYTEINENLYEIENNEFYKVFILPINRVQYKVTVDGIDSLNEEKNPRLKAKGIIEKFQMFIDLCQKEIIEVEKLYKEFKSQYIQNFLRKDSNIT